MMRALLSKRNAWDMARASYWHARGYGCDFWYSAWWALRLFVDEVRRSR